ncbi:MAG: transglutaminase-like domain-containing protein [Clostridia bacterium]
MYKPYVPGTGVTAEAAYSIGFGTKDIEITSPDKNALPFDGSLTIEGETSLPEVWLCVRGPGGELETSPRRRIEGQVRRIKVSSTVRGGHLYTVWAGDNPKEFDGKIRFQVENTAAEDTRYLAPSAYVDSDHEDIIATLAEDLADPDMTATEKIRAIHQWAASNIEYDYKAYLEGDNTMRTASETIKRGKGTCRDYSFVVAALARALGIPAKVVYGSVNRAPAAGTRSSTPGMKYTPTGAGSPWTPPGTPDT